MDQILAEDSLEGFFVEVLILQLAQNIGLDAARDLPLDLLDVTGVVLPEVRTLYFHAASPRPEYYAAAGRPTFRTPGSRELSGIVEGGQIG